MSTSLYTYVQLDFLGMKITLPEWVANNIEIRYNDVIMGVMASQITSLTIVYSIVYLGADQRKHQSSASLAFVWWIHRRPVNSLHKGPVTRKWFHLMTSSCTSHQSSRNGLSYRRRVLYNNDTADPKPLWYIYVWKISINYGSAVVLNDWYLMQWCINKRIYFMRYWNLIK